jgi:hypothetical protein
MIVEIFDGEKLPPIDNIKVRIEVAGDAESSIITASLSYDTKYGPIGWLMDKLVVSKKFGGAFAGIFAGLKHHAETGEHVDRDTALPYDQVNYLAA